MLVPFHVSKAQAGVGVTVILTLMAAVWIIILTSSSQPPFASDEYAYWAAARDRARGLTAGEFDAGLQFVPNNLYAAWLSILQTGFSEPYIIARAFNIFFWILGAATICLAVRKDLSSAKCVLVFALLVGSGGALHAASVMPEGAYFGFALTAIALSARFAGSRLVLSHAMFGLIAGQLLFVKPHAVSLILGGAVGHIAFAITEPNGWLEKVQRTGFGVIIFLAATFLSVFIGSQLWIYPRGESFVGAFYQSIALGQGARDPVPVSDILQYILANGAAAFVIAGPLALLPIAALRSSRTRKSAMASVSFRVWVLSIMALGSAIAMTSMFSANVGSQVPGEAFRFFARYYGAYAVVVGVAAATFALSQELNEIFVKVGAGLYLAALLVLLLQIIGPFRLYPWDAPWLSAFVPVNPDGWHWVPPIGFRWLTLAALAALSGFIIWRSKRPATPHFATMVVLAGFSTITTGWWLDTNRDERRTIWQEANTYLALVEASASDLEGLIVGQDRYDHVSLVLMATDDIPRVVIRDADVPLPRDLVWPSTRWILMFGNHTAEFPDSARIGGTQLSLVIPNPTKSGRLVDIKTSEARPAPAWNGAPFTVDLGSDGEWWRGQNFNSPEVGFQWTNAEKASVELPYTLSGRVRVDVSGWTVPENLSTPVRLIVGSSEIILPFTDSNSSFSAEFDIDAPIATLEIVSATHSDGRTVGVAIGRLSFWSINP